jgi:hypothetical protein
MTITKADLIAAREAVMMIPKEAQTPWSGNEATAAYESEWSGADSPEYWVAKHNKAKEAGDERSLKQFIEDEFKKYVDATDQYKKDVRDGGGMIDRYTGSAGMVGGVLGALLGGLVGGGKGAAIGGILGALGLYAIQKLGIFDGTAVEDFFKNGVDKIFGDAVTPEEIAQVETAKNKSLKTAQDKLKQQAETGEEPSPGIDPETWGNNVESPVDIGPTAGPSGLSIQQQRINAGEALPPVPPLIPTLPTEQEVVATPKYGPTLEREAELEAQQEFASQNKTPEQVARETIQNYKEVHTPTVLPEPKKPVPTGNKADDIEAQAEYEAELDKRRALESAQRDYRTRTERTPESARETMRRYREFQTPTVLPPVKKPVPTGNKVDDIEARIEYENQLRVRQELAKGRAERQKRIKAEHAELAKKYPKFKKPEPTPITAKAQPLGWEQLAHRKPNIGTPPGDFLDRIVNKDYEYSGGGKNPFNWFKKYTDWAHGGEVDREIKALNK